MYPVYANPPNDVVLTNDSRRAAFAVSLVAGSLLGSVAGIATAKRIGSTALVFPVVGALAGVAAWGLTWASAYPAQEIYR